VLLAGGGGGVKDFIGAVATTSIDGFDVVGCEMFLCITSTQILVSEFMTERL